MAISARSRHRRWRRAPPPAAAGAAAFLRLDFPPSKATGLADTYDLPLGVSPRALILRQTFMSCSAGCTIFPASTLMPRTRASLERQLPEASLFTHGRMAAQMACEEVCGTAPGMLVTQKWVTPSST